MTTAQATEEPKRHYRSVSQLQQYEKCPYSWYLARVLKAWKRPAAWLAQGSAVHEAAEAWELSNREMTLAEVQDAFKESYATHINEACETTPNLDFWFRSGPYAGAADIERRFGIGLEHIERFVNWHLSHPEQVIWVAPDGTPGIELGFDFELDGVWIRGFIDAIRVVEGERVVVDYKSGNKMPPDDFQLGVYGLALAEMYGIDPPKRGEYFMTKTGKPTYPYDLGEWTRGRISEKFRKLEDDIQAQRFDPDPEPSKCMFCDVRTSCEYSAD